MRNTITNVTTLVIVLITSCHVSEYLNRGPVAIHAITRSSEQMNAVVLPAQSLTRAENPSTARVQQLPGLMGRPRAVRVAAQRRPIARARATAAECQARSGRCRLPP